MSDFLFAFKLGHLLHITYLKVHILFCIMFGVAVYIDNSLKVCLCLCPEKDKVQLIPLRDKVRLELSWLFGVSLLIVNIRCSVAFILFLMPTI